MPSTIGDLNGKWSILFKYTMVSVSALMPFLIVWATWCTASVFSLAGDHREFLTRNEMSVMERDLTKQLNALPPVEWRDRVRLLESKYSVINGNQIKILTILERIDKTHD